MIGFLIDWVWLTVRITAIVWLLLLWSVGTPYS